MTPGVPEPFVFGHAIRLGHQSIPASSARPHDWQAPQLRLIMLIFRVFGSPDPVPFSIVASRQVAITSSSSSVCRRELRRLFPDGLYGIRFFVGRELGLANFMAIPKHSELNLSESLAECQQIGSDRSRVVINQLQVRRNGCSNWHNYLVDHGNTTERGDCTPAAAGTERPDGKAGAGCSAPPELPGRMITVPNHHPAPVPVAATADRGKARRHGRLAYGRCAGTGFPRLHTLGRAGQNRSANTRSPGGAA